jgi:hypothetical protein
MPQNRSESLLDREKDSRRAITCYFTKGVAGMIPTARDIPPTQPSARRDAFYPKRRPSNSLYLSLGEWPRLPSIARIGRAQFHRARSASKEGPGRSPSLLFQQLVKRMVRRGLAAIPQRGSRE